MKIARHMGPSSGKRSSGTGNKDAPGIGKSSKRMASKEKKGGSGSHGVANGKHGIQSR